MVARDRLDRPFDEIADLKRRLSDLECASPLGNSSITRGRLRVASNEGLLVEGSAKVEGWLVVTGTERVTGTLEVQGDLSVTGPSSFTGAMSLLGTMTVQSPGKIVISGGSSPATLENGALSFGTGGKVEADVANGGVQIGVGTNRFYAGTAIASLQMGLRALTMTPSGVFLQNLPTIPASTAGVPAGCLYITSSGELFRVV